MYFSTIAVKMERKIMNELIQRKNSIRRKPLILEWARQVGKTYILQEFWKSYFKNVAYINFQDYKWNVGLIFKEDLDPIRIISEIKILTWVNIVPNDTLIIFDEIQEEPRALTSLKYFCENAPEYCVVAAWSLLWLSLHHWASFPVGKVDSLNMYPMDFEEFLWANWKKDMVEYLKKWDLNKSAFDWELYDLFKKYVFIWWMPEVVNDWILYQDVNSVNKIQTNIIENYKKDFDKHTDTKDMAIRIREVFNNIIPQFAKENTKFFYWTIRTWARAKDYELAIEWLIDAGIVKKVYNVQIWNRIPLSAHVNFQNFKLYLLDIWLVRNIAEISYKTIMDSEEIFSTFNWLITEQFVLQQLSNHKLYYWTSVHNEVDFITQIDDRIIPIEVKSWLNLQSKSLKAFREMCKPEVSVRFSLQKTKYEDWLLELTLYKCFLFDSIISKI